MTIWFPGLSAFWPVFDGFSVSANLKTPESQNHIILFKVISVVDKDFYRAFPVFTDKFQVCRVSEITPYGVPPLVFEVLAPRLAVNMPYLTNISNF